MTQLRQALLDTNFIHRPLPVDDSRSVEARLLQKTPLDRRALWTGDFGQWSHGGRGGIVPAQDAGTPVLRLWGNTVYDSWPEGASPDGDYTSFGATRATLRLDGEDWRGYNRLRFRVRPDCPGARAVHLNMHLVNEGETKIPDIYWREGCHVMNLNNHCWNECVWEFPDLPRDRITAVVFHALLNGKDATTGDTVAFDIAHLALELVADTEPQLGWSCPPGRVSYSTSGYWTAGRKTAVASPNVQEFDILDEAGKTVYRGASQTVSFAGAEHAVLDFSPLQAPGRYRIQAGGTMTEPFAIADDLLHDAAWKVINFLFCERCGCPVSGRHGTCHGDFVAEHNGVKLVYNGGWHDAGDVSQQTLQSAEVAHGLLELAQAVRHSDPPLYRRLMEEAEWGLDFLLRTRFGDGYRATSVGATRWTRGFIGDMDDVAVRVHTNALENFLGAGIEAYAAAALKGWDDELAWKCAEVARQDFAFAEERYRTHGHERPNFYEHTYNTGASQFAATASWAASMLLALTGEAAYGQRARDYMDDMLACQQTGEAALELKGFFYRDRAKTHIVHFNHQARDHAYAQALQALCATQPEHADLSRWQEALRLHGAYLKGLLAYASPYGMLPAGVYAEHEAGDRETFGLLHLLSDYDQERANYAAQVRGGAPLGNGHYVKQFPVWFSFRGNLAVHVAMGKAAAICGSYLQDDELLEAARDQLYWVAGRNPFCQSLMYGEGSNYAQQYAVFPGEMVGELPVGVQTLGNGDEPYWPQANTATYKEVWTSSASHWLWLAAELYHGGKA